MTLAPSDRSGGRQLLIAQAKLQVRQLGPQQLRLWRRKCALLLDLRPREHYLQGHIAGAVWVEFPGFGLTIDQLAPDFAQALICCSHRGDSSAVAAYHLQQLGYQQVASLRGGVKQWDQRLVPG